MGSIKIMEPISSHHCALSTEIVLVFSGSFSYGIHQKQRVILLCFSFFVWTRLFCLRTPSIWSLVSHISERMDGAQ